MGHAQRPNAEELRREQAGVWAAAPTNGVRIRLSAPDVERDSTADDPSDLTDPFPRLPGRR